MKKLMVVACAVAMAAVAQAGAVKWSATQISEAPDVTFGAGVTYSAYLFIGDDVSAVTKYLVGEEQDFDAFGKAALASRTQAYDTTKEVLTFGAIGSGDYANVEITAFMIVLNAADIEDATYYQVVEKSETPYITKTFGKNGDQTYAWGSQAENTNWQSIPEPTSGLLLLLGVAGLALRRRRA